MSWLCFLMIDSLWLRLYRCAFSIVIVVCAVSSEISFLLEIEKLFFFLVR